MDQEQALEASLQKANQLCRMLEEKEAAKAKQLLSSKWKLSMVDGLERDTSTSQTPVCSSRTTSTSRSSFPDTLSLGESVEDAVQRTEKRRDSTAVSSSKSDLGIITSKNQVSSASKQSHTEGLLEDSSGVDGSKMTGKAQETNKCESRPASVPSVGKRHLDSALVDLSVQDQKAEDVGPQAFIDSPSWQLKRRGSAQLSRRSSMSTSSRTTLGGESSLLPEVLAYDAFRAEHGTCGGWLSDDHADFERILRASRGDEHRAHAAIAAELFHILPEEIAAHSRWYAKHVELLAQKKAAINAWKYRREAERRARLQEQPLLEPTPEERRQSQLQRQESKKRVQEWKAAREREQREIADAEAARREAAAAAAATEAAAAQADKHTQLQAFRERKAAEQRKAQEEANAAAQEARAQMQLTEEQIEAVRQRTQEHLKRQAALAAAQQARKREQQARLDALQQQATAALGVKAEADPERVLAPTRSFNQRGAAEEPGPVRYGGSSIRNVAKKAVPAWRKTA